MPQNMGLKKSGQEGSQETPRELGAVPIRTAREIWQVIADNLSQGEEEIRNTPGVPQQGDTRGALIVRRATARETNADALLWEVEVEWDSRIDLGTSESENPEDWTPDIRWTSETLELPIAFDQWTGLPIENSVGEPFFVTTPYPIPVRTYTKYEDRDINDYYDDLIRDYVNTINSEEFHGWPADTVLLASIDAVPVVINNNRLARVTYVTKYLWLVEPNIYRPRREYPSDAQNPVSTLDVVGWKASLLNQGTKYLQTANSDIDDAIPFEDLHGNKTTGNLNIDGTKITDNLPGNYLRFWKNRRKDLNALTI